MRFEYTVSSHGQAMDKARIFTWLSVALAAVAAFLYWRQLQLVQPSNYEPVRVDIVTGGPGEFWKLVLKGASDASEEFNVSLRVHEPAVGGDDQTTILTKLDPMETDGVAISPLMPAAQSRILSLLAAKTKVVTYDNDAPSSTRLSYIGTNNWSAGQLCADLVREAIPDGGQVALFVGDHERENARHRRRAFLAALNGMRPNQGPEHPDLEEPITIGNYTVVKTYLDQHDPERAKKNVISALDEYPELDCLVGLYGYNGPACLQALEENNKLGKIQIIAFDEHKATLKGIEEGTIYGTVAQEPYSYGYEAIRLLAQLNRRPASSAPYAGSGTIYLPCRIVKHDDRRESEAGVARPSEE